MIAFFLILFITLFTKPVYASSIQPVSVALQVGPAIIETIMAPDEMPEETSISIYNSTNFPLPIKGAVREFLAREEIEPRAKTIFDASSWITLDPADFILQPKATQTVAVSIDPPQNAEPGGHYATIYFEPLIPQEVISPENSYISERVGVLVFLIMKGDIVQSARMGTARTIPFRQFGPIDFAIPIKNEGNVHLRPAITIDIYSMRNKKVKQLIVPSSIVLPRTTKIYQTQWDKKFLLGKFRAQAHALYGSEGKKLTSEMIEFWVIPWVSLLILFCILTFFIICFTLLKARLRLAIKILMGKK